MVFIDLIFFICLEQKIKLKSHKKIYKKEDFCDVIMPSVDTKILEFNQPQKSDKSPYVDYLCRSSIFD